MPTTPDRGCKMWHLMRWLPSCPGPKIRKTTDTSNCRIGRCPPPLAWRFDPLYVVMSYNYYGVSIPYGPSGGTCFPPRWCELLVGRPLRDVRVDHFSYPTSTRSRWCLLVPVPDPRWRFLPQFTLGRVTPTIPHLAKATRPDPGDATRGYTRTGSLPVRLQLDLLGKGIIGLWLWLDAGLWKSPVSMWSDSTPTSNVVRSTTWRKVDFTRRGKKIDMKSTSKRLGQ